ncbi:D-alanyl-D-alanine carboxypeptidase/D-alanyl-D-alanine endopeptidase [Chitinilyticum litopenaei]|uniref:D-alanyl-D-alanine carboxypeptidase/D-alanyl-D-alanine endopeptidase n=1 Tax=Chitinilyticum litopenaei TaxID=1121276 RepID=UPI00048F3BFD|nr:D-alanyl-D-alanine carboxypeptidase/D-alanyl-D-alanine-endopeptidase [Chitinilyticum litopenaei]
MNRLRHSLRHSLALGVLTLLAPAALAAGLPASVQQALKASGLPAEALHVSLLPLDGGRPAHIRADEAVSPASTMKLVTTWAGLNLLGPAWQWQTDILAEQKPVNGVLDGELYLRGSGDPKLTIERMWLLVRELRAAGVDDIRGRLVLDGSVFGPLALPQDYEDDGDTERAFLVQPDALLSNFRTLRITIDSTGERVQIQTEPPLNQVRVSNDLALGEAGDCANWSKRIQQRAGQVTGVHWLVQFVGEMPRGCRAVRYVPALTPRDYTAALFWYLWYAEGGKGSGHSLKPEGRAVPEAAQILASTRSPDVTAIVRDINKFSNNVMARQLFLTLGSHQAGGSATGTPTDIAAQEAVRGWLTSEGLDWPELVIENGSGLSRRERISTRHLADLLRQAWRSPLAAEFVSSLPLVGLDGTMKKRLTQPGEAGLAHLKTGSLRDVRAIAGYVRDDKGKNWALVGIINHAEAPRGVPVLDALTRSVLRGEWR